MHDGMTGTYTLDKLVVLMRVDAAQLQTLILRVGAGARKDYGLLARQWFSTKVGTYKHNYIIEIDKGVSYYIGIQRWDDAPNEYRVNLKLEFNPAKVSGYSEFLAVYNDLLMMAYHVDFGRYDIAIDIPIPRDRVQLRKDQRRYLDYCYSASNRTEYLGQRSDHGHVKVYNKALEQGVEGDLTRVEITLDYERSTWAEFVRVFPDVYYFDRDLEQSADVGGSDYVLMLACADDINRLSYIPIKRRKKIGQLLKQAALNLLPDEVQFKTILHEIRTFGKSIRPNLFEELESGEGFPKED